MGTPLGSVVWVPAAAVELGTLSHLPCWLPVLRRGGRPDSPPTWGTAQAAGAPRRAAPGLQGTWVSGIQASLLPRAVWAVPGLERGRWGQIKASFPGGLFVLRFYKEEGVGQRRGGPLLSAPHRLPPLAGQAVIPPEPDRGRLSARCPRWSQGKGCPLPRSCALPARCPAAATGTVPARLATSPRSIGGCCAD